ncbi:DNA repair protein RadC [Haliea sp.]|uniref:JAB domain-containing protein n=1 Tax=Haliea sp. TaxID=1932666 RepID=UPI000C5F8054|nr:DNA repair protein RadC [Haliea sp.]MAD63853.1 DNA repair protein RadC [Haliea sp.]MAY92214.1 DNA repair protein RadC [Haliea sp.]MBK42138.1 DNA repair protein RadC [Haliea sp.]MBP69802.1 DNA repair protein RadC [Haliea sp.]
MTTQSKLNNSSANNIPNLIKSGDGRYQLSEPASLDDVYNLMLQLLEEKYLRPDTLSSPDAVRRYLQVKLANRDHEVFSVVFLDSQHQVLHYEEMFRGTIDGAAVYPREVVKRCLQINAAAVIFSHPHPSGVPEPSTADIRITQRLTEALRLVDIRVLDHIVIGGTDSVSFAERGLL